MVDRAGNRTSWVNDLPVAAGIEVAAPWAGIVLLGIGIVVLPLCIRKIYGWLGAAIGAIAMATVYPFSNLFMAGCIDHHGLIVLAGSACLLLISVGGGGWVGNATFHAEKRARRWFVASGLAAATLLWLSAASAIPYFAGIGLVVLSLAGIISKNDPTGSNSYHANLWPLWGVSGALGSLFFYFLEYFPDHFGWRLEVNHPLYAVALLSAGECFYRLLHWRTAGENPFGDRRGILSLVLALLGLVLIPAFIHFGKERVFLVSDPFLWRLHSDYIEEFKPLFSLLRQQDWVINLLILGPLPLLILAVGRVLWDRRTCLVVKTTLAIPFGTALLITALGFWQSRWYNIANGPWIVVLIVQTGFFSQTSSQLRFARWEKVCTALFLILLVGYLPSVALLDVRDVYRNKANLGLDEERSIVVRDVAYRLRRSVRPGDPTPVIASSPTVTTQLLYFGGLRGLGTLYWENIEGLKSAAELYSAGDSETARRLVQQDDVSRIAIFSGENLIFGYPILWRGLPKNSFPQDTFAYRLVTGQDLPFWVRRIPYSSSNRIPNKAVWAIIYDVEKAKMAQP